LTVLRCITVSRGFGIFIALGRFEGRTISGNIMSDNELKISILRYLSKHPESRDTIEGIVTWWLMRERIDSSLMKITSAVDELVAEDILVPKGNALLSRTYSLNKEKLSDILKLINNMSH
jgi:hypothetical protein